MTELSPEPKQGLTTVQWLICVIAAIGFAFDIYELLMLPLIVRDALTAFGIPPTIGGAPNPEFGTWVGRLFYIPAFAGGIFGLFGGYLTDRLGRRRVLTWSILLYAFSAFFAGFSTNVWMLLILRSTTFIGVCIEFVAAVAWLAELFTDPVRREKVLGYTQAFSSVGGLLVAAAYIAAVEWGPSLPAIRGSHEAWRYTLMSGVIPAIPLIVIRPFLPESPIWARKKEAGTLRRPSIKELFAPAFRQTTIVTALMFAFSYGAAFGAIQHMPRIIPGIPQVQADVREATGGQSTQEAKGPAKGKAIAVEQKAAGTYQTVQEVGGLVGRFMLAFLVVRIVSRRALIRVFQIPGLILIPFVFGWAAIHNPTLLTIGDYQVTLLAVGIFLIGLLTVAQFSFWGNYLPRMYPVHLRGTGESFAANIGGRMIGTSFAWVTSTLAVQPFMPGDTTPMKLAYTAAIVGTFVYVAGLICSFFLPEPGPEEAEE